MLINLDYLLSIYLFFMSCVMFCFLFKHLLMLIISLEFIMITLIYNLYLITVIMESMMYIIMLMLIMFVCEGALSLSLIVLMIRLNGNDYVNSLSLIKW